MFSVAAALLGVVLSLLLVWFVLERHKEQLEEEWLGRLNALKEEWEQNLRQTKEELEQKIRQKEAKWQKMDEVEWEWKKQMEAKQLEWEQESARSFERDFSVMVSAVSRYITEPNAQRRKDALAAIEPVRAVADGALATCLDELQSDITNDWGEAVLEGAFNAAIQAKRAQSQSKARTEKAHGVR